VSDLVTLGETMALLAAPRVGRLRDMRSLRLSAAGSESNVAIGVSRLGYNASWTGRVGHDELGQMILTTLRAEGVDVSRSVVDPEAQTALMFKERRGPNVARVTYYRRGYAGSRLSTDDLDEALIKSARLLHVTGITLALSESARAATYRAVEMARSAAVPVSFDFNYRSALWSPDEAAVEFRSMTGKADLVFAGEEELAIVAPDDLVEGARRLADGGARAVVVKRGPKGAFSVTESGLHEELPRSVVAVDPVGAGDAFVAGYIVATFDGLDVQGRLAMGSAAGAYAVTMLGDWEGMPTREDLVLMSREEGTTIR
jgi:2-dehydro-3-deoxygluconokinase